MLTQHDIISKLKLQPRHGQAGAGAEMENLSINIRSAVTDLINLGQTLVDITQASSDAISSLDKLNKGFVTTTGIKTLNTQLVNTANKIKAVINTATILEERNKGLQKSFGISTQAAAKLGVGLDKIATTYKIAGINARTYANNIKSLVPLLNQQASMDKSFFKGMIQTQDILKENIGLTDEQANAYTAYASQQGENAVRTLKAAEALSKELDPTGTMGYFKMVTQGVADAGSEIQLQYGKIPGNLELAVIKANKFGLSLDKLKSTADNLLNIESSIGQELEYQLLSGRRLVDNSGKSLTNAFREATLRGEAVDQANILNEIIETEGETLTNNLFARKQMASLLGMEEKQLASALQKKKIFDKAAEAGITLNIDDEGALAAAAEQLKETGELTAAEFESFKKETDTRTTEDLLNEILHVQQEQLFYSQLMNQEKLIAATKTASTETFNAAIEGFKNAFQTTIGGKKAVSDSQLQTIGKAKITVVGAKQAGLVPASLESMLPDSMVSDTSLPGTVGSNSAPTGTGKVVEDLFLSATSGNVISGPLGSFSLAPEDDVLAAPNIRESLAGASSNNNSADFMKFASIIVNAINQQTIALREKPGTMNTSRFA